MCIFRWILWFSAHSARSPCFSRSEEEAAERARELDKSNVKDFQSLDTKLRVAKEKFADQVQPLVAVLAAENGELTESALSMVEKELDKALLQRDRFDVQFTKAETGQEQLESDLVSPTPATHTILAQLKAGESEFQTL